jgi:hypothetical protein
MQSESWHSHAEAVRADDAQQIRLCLIEHRLLEIGSKPCGDDDDGTRTLLAECFDKLGEVAGGVAMTASSGGSGNAAMSGKHRLPAIAS